MSCVVGEHQGPIVPRRKSAFAAVWWCSACDRRVGTKRVAIALLTEDDRRALRPVPVKKRRARPGKRRRDYQRFLRSRAWRAQRLRVLQRDGYECRHCGALATEADHLTYGDPIEATVDSQIVASCNDCNLERRASRIAFGRRACAR